MNKTRNYQFDNIILWKGRPEFKPYLFAHIFSYKHTVRILLIGLTISLTGNLWYKTKYDWNSFTTFICILCFLAFLEILLKIISYRNTKYWITKDAVYLQTGVIRPKVTSIKKDKIVFINIEKSSVEAKHEAGTVLIDDGEIEKGDFDEYKVYKRLIAIRHPEKAVRFF